MIYEAFPKLIELGEFSPEGEPTLQIVRPGEYNSLPHVKVASESQDYIKHVRPIPGKTIILVLAMTAGEFYGPNNNGDGWPERPLIAGNTKIGPSEVLPKHYKTFETNASVFKHHLNKTPRKKLGDVLRAFYNWPMHRVELLLALDNHRALHAINCIDKEEFPAVSMGCKIMYDVCNICGNKAPTRKEYCSHAKNYLGRYLPNGRRVFVWNPSPRFFDLSIVRRPADKHGFMMKKVANYVPEIRSSAIMGEYIENASRKTAKLNKMAIINKVINGEAVAAKEDNNETHILKDFGDRIAKPVASSMQPLADDTIREMLKYHPAEVLSTLSSMGILLTTPEFIKYFVWKVAPGTQIPEGALDRAVACQQGVYTLLANNPQLLDDINDMGFTETSDKYVNDELAQKAEPLMEKRSQAKDYLYRHLVPDVFKEDTRHLGNWDVINVQDPKTGRTYRTTRMAATQASDEAGKRQLQNLVGGGALLAGAAGLSMIPMAGLAGGALGYAGAKRFAKGYQGYPSARAETGERVYGRPTANWSDKSFPGTELVEKRSSDSGADDTNTMIRIAMDLAHRPESQNECVNIDWCETAEDVSFEEAIAKLGEVICP